MKNLFYLFVLNVKTNILKWSFASNWWRWICMLGSASHFVVQIHYTHLKQMLFRGFRGHIGITLSCQFLCSVSATPPCINSWIDTGETLHSYSISTWGCARMRITLIQTISREIISSSGCGGGGGIILWLNSTVLVVIVK